MATELTFAKAFLGLLDTKPTKITADHIEDPRNYPASIPYVLPRHPTAKPFSKPALPSPSFPSSSSPQEATTTTTTTTATTTSATATAAAAGEPTVTVTLRSPRNPPLELVLPALPASTSLAEVKARAVAEAGLGGGVGVERVKLLFGKRPVADSKVLADLVGGGGDPGKHLELGVMVLGGGVVVGVGSGGGGRAVVSGKEKEEKLSNKEEGRGGGGDGAVAVGLSGRGVLETEQFWGDLKGFLQQRVRDEAVAGEAVQLFRGAWAGR